MSHIGSCSCSCPPLMPLPPYLARGCLTMTMEVRGCQISPSSCSWGAGHSLGASSWRASLHLVFSLSVMLAGEVGGEQEQEQEQEQEKAKEKE